MVATQRDAQQVKADIERARDQLAGAVDELADRLAPKRLIAEARETATAQINSPRGRAILGATVLLVAVLAVRNIRKSRR